MPLPTVTIQVKGVPRVLWAEVSALSTMQAKEKGEIVIAALEEYLASRKEVR
jgi:hypothetical protein